MSFICNLYKLGLKNNTTVDVGGISVNLFNHRYWFSCKDLFEGFTTKVDSGTLKVVIPELSFCTSNPSEV